MFFGTLEELQSFMLAEPAGRRAKEGDSPVSENIEASFSIFLSTAGHVEPCGNLGGPSSKAKYYLVTDSEQVP